MPEGEGEKKKKKKEEAVEEKSKNKQTATTKPTNQTKTNTPPTTGFEVKIIILWDLCIIPGNQLCCLGAFRKLVNSDLDWDFFFFLIGKKKAKCGDAMHCFLRHKWWRWYEKPAGKWWVWNLHCNVTPPKSGGPWNSVSSIANMLNQGVCVCETVINYTGRSEILML